MLDQYIYVDAWYHWYNGIKVLIRGYQYYKTNQTLMFGGYLKVREALYTWIIVWVATILHRIDTRTWRFLHGIQTWMVWKTKISSITHTMLVYQKSWKSHYKITKWYENKTILVKYWSWLTTKTCLTNAVLNKRQLKTMCSNIITLISSTSHLP